MVQSRGSDENIGDADWRALVEQPGVEAGGNPGACGIEGQNLQGGDEPRDFGPFALAMFRRCPIRPLEKLELGDD